MENRPTVVEIRAFALEYKGQIISAPKPTKAEAEAYLERMMSRHGQNEATLDIIYARRPVSKRGGPYKYVLGDRKKPYPIPKRGEILAATTLQEARAFLRDALEQDRLPPGTEIEPLRD